MRRLTNDSLSDLKEVFYVFDAVLYDFSLSLTSFDVWSCRCNATESIEIWPVQDFIIRQRPYSMNIDDEFVPISSAEDSSPLICLVSTCFSHQSSVWSLIYIKKLSTDHYPRVNHVKSVFRILYAVLQAIGLRMTRENEAEQRTRQQRALQAIINEKRAELDRSVRCYVCECDCLSVFVSVCMNVCLSAWVR